jgi:hypothetical protein
MKLPVELLIFLHRTKMDLSLYRLVLQASWQDYKSTGIK